MRFVDSHVHLSDFGDPAAVVREAKEVGTLLLAASIDGESSFKTLSIAEMFPKTVRGFVGVHPSEAGKARGLDWLADALNGAAGVGEIGLDPHYEPQSTRLDQERVCETQLAAAEKAGKPVQVHTRGAEKGCLDILSSYTITSVLLHWFEGEDLLEIARERGYYVSFGPALLRSVRLQRMAKKYERDLVLAETDGPVPFKELNGTRGPFLIPSVVFKLSEIFQEDFDRTCRRLESNAAKYLSAGKG